MPNTKFFAVLCAVAFVAACASEPEPLVIQGEPVFDKYGNSVGFDLDGDGDYDADDEAIAARDSDDD